MRSYSGQRRGAFDLSGVYLRSETKDEMDFLNPRRSLRRTEKSGRSSGHSTVGDVDRGRGTFGSRAREGLILTRIIERETLCLHWSSPFRSFLAPALLAHGLLITIKTPSGISYGRNIDDIVVIRSKRSIN